MIFTIITRSSHLQNSRNALELANSLLKQKHTINCIYFIFDGAYNANNNIDLPSDEYEATRAWSKLAQDYNLILAVCAASAARRGITIDCIAPGFTLGSIGQLVEACDTADRVVTL